MSKASPIPATGSKTAESAKPVAKLPPQDASRETLESIAFAFVLALLFRTFIVEAFVIPTGSMAPTLFGRNKDVACEECKYLYQVGASEEVNDDGYLLLRIEKSVCPNCRHLNNIRELPVFKGDRILVNKFSYQVGNPDRWDVIVFRYPEDPQKNYIKRLLGLPGETLRIAHGDVYARQSEEGEFKILRKQNPNKQKVLQQLVYDDRNPPVNQLAKGWPERWSAMTRNDSTAAVDGWSPDDGGWRHDPKSRSFTVEPTSNSRWLRYQHFVPGQGDWSTATDGTDPATEPRRELITDFCGYNMYTGGHGHNLDTDRFWVGDLTLNCVIDITSVNSSKNESSELLLELVEGVRRYHCRIDVVTGKATLLRNDDLAGESSLAAIEIATAQTPIRGPGKYTITFANVDDRLCLWVNSTWLNNGLIPFGSGAEYSPPGTASPQNADLCPVGIAAQGIAATVSDLVLQRDIYYRSEHTTNSGQHEQELSESVQRVQESLSHPTQYGDIYREHAHEAIFRALGPDEFFVMGDNSPRSLDSRLWPNSLKRENRPAVPRQALLGKAFFIYWPHGIPFLNGGKGFKLLNHSREANGLNNGPNVETYPEYVVPFYPQWWRWKRIR